MRRRIAALLLTLAPAAAAAQLDGRPVGIEFRADAPGGFVDPLGTPIVGPGIEATYDIYLSIDVSDRAFTIANPAGFGSGVFSFAAASGFQGIHLFDAGANLAPFVSVLLGSSTVAGVDQSRIAFDADNIYVNLRGLSFPDGRSLTVLVNPLATTVPEPSTWALLGGGLLGVAGVAARRRRRLSA